MIKSINESNFESEVLNYEGICLVDFYANWCGPCMAFTPILEEIGNSRSNCKVIKLDVDKNHSIVKKLNISTVPTLCLYKNGKFIEKKIGIMTRDEVIDFIQNN